MTETEVFEIILHAGNARASAYEALRAAQAGDFAQAEANLAQAEQEVGAAHHAQTAAIQEEAQGKLSPVTLLAVHAQDHLMTAVAEKGLIEQMVAMCKTIRGLSQRLEAVECKD